MSKKFYIYFLLIVVVLFSGYSLGQESLIAPGAEIKKLAGDFVFTEGPACDANGNIFFTDVQGNRIHKWSTDGELSTFLENTEGANGLYFDKSGNLIACRGSSGLASIDPNGEVTMLAENYDSNSFNSLNDLWVTPDGMVYFSDPSYGRGAAGGGQDGEHVYCYSPENEQVIRVIDDMTRPNGMIGTADGKMLYVTDAGSGQTFSYTINEDGTLSDKKLFVSEGADGMSIDSKGNVYMATSGVAIYDPNGQLIEMIEVSERPSNITFGGTDRKTLFITARTSLYSIDMQVTGIMPAIDTSALGFEQDIIETNEGDLKMTFIGHASLMFEFAGRVIHIDPVSREGDYSKMPRADFIIITHEHGDHFEPALIESLSKENTQIILTETCAQQVQGDVVMKNGDTETVDGLKIEAIPAYNIERSNHPKGVGNGYILTLGDKRVYVAGDTENTPEMKQLEDIDIAFLPMNQPFTMTPEQVADAALAFKPKILYPYHYSQTDTNQIVELLKDSEEIEVRIRQLQ